MSGKGKGGRGKGKAKGGGSGTSTAAKAGLQFPCARLTRYLRGARPRRKSMIRRNRIFAVLKRCKNYVAAKRSNGTRR